MLCCVWLPCLQLGRPPPDEFDPSVGVAQRAHRVAALNGMVTQLENRDSMALLAAIFTGQCTWGSGDLYLWLHGL